jgi:hypothetical protein
MYLSYIMISKPKTCDILVRILPSTQKLRVQSFSQYFFPTNKMDEKIHRTFK